MGLNIIVRHGTPTRWDAVVRQFRSRRDFRLQRWSREGAAKLAERSQVAINTIPDNQRANVFIVDRQTDGRLMDICRHLKGHTNWRGDADMLKFAAKCDDFAPVIYGQEQAFDRLVSNAKEATLTPFYSTDPSVEERRQSDLAKLPARYREGIQP